MIPSEIRRDEYLIHALNFRKQEIMLQKKLMQWLPDSIIDCHVHNNLLEHVEYMEEKVVRSIISTFPSFSISESDLLDKRFYPGKFIKKLRFPHVFRGIDHKKANDYLLNNSRIDDRIAIFGLPEDVQYTTEIMQHPRTTALKMYYLYVNPTATYIYECFPPDILEVAQTLNLPIILHLPRLVTFCVEDLLKLLNDFPRLTVVLAHLGLPKIPVPGLFEAYKIIANNNRVFLDTAMNPSSEVIKMALNAFGSDRIMFGSDEPVNMLRYVVYMNPNLGQRVVTEYKYHWANASEHYEYSHLAQKVAHVHWQSINAIKKVIDSLAKNERITAKENIFHNNAKAVFSF